MRQAAAVTDAAAAAAIAAIADGAARARRRRGMLRGDDPRRRPPPGFGPFIRPAARLGEEHTTWGDGRFRAGEPVFLELSGCVVALPRPARPAGASRRRRRRRRGHGRDRRAGLRRRRRRAPARRAAARGLRRLAGRRRRGRPSHYRRHHCGYAVGIGVPPSWTGGNAVTGLRHDSDLVIAAGMSFHVLSWLMGTGPRRRLRLRHRARDRRRPRGADPHPRRPDRPLVRGNGVPVGRVLAASWGRAARFHSSTLHDTGLAEGGIR